MPIYIYKAKRGPSEMTQGEIEADSQDKAISKLDERGLVAVSVIEKGIRPSGIQRPALKAARPGPGARGGGPQDKQAASGIRIKTHDVDIFTRQIASLVRSSVPILRALSLITQQTENKTLRYVVGDLSQQVKSGKMLSEAMAKYPKVFDNLYLSMVRSGEKSGALDEILERVAEHREKEQETKRKVQAAMAYPLLMMVVGIATIFVMFTYFLPKLAGLFDNMQQSLPIPTRILMGMADFMSGNGHWLLIALVLTFAIFGRTKQGSKKKFLFDIIKLHVPVLREFIKNADIAKFTNSLSLLLKNGIPIYESLELAAGALDNEVLKERIKAAGEEIINQGSTLSKSLDDADILPPFAVNMITVGEEGGKLQEVLDEISGVYEREVDQAIKVITSLIEPALILIVGAVVGFIVFAMLLPIFNIGLTPR